MLPAVFDFLNGPVRDLVTQIYEAVGYLGVALWVAIESVIIPIPSELVLPVRRFPRRRGRGARADHRAALELLADRACRHARGDRRGAHRVRHRRVGRPSRSSSAGVATSGSRAADLDKADDFFARHGAGGRLLRPDDPGHPLAGLVRGGDLAHAARQVHALLVPRLGCRGRRCSCSPGSSSARTGRRSGPGSSGSSTRSSRSSS